MSDAIELLLPPGARWMTTAEVAAMLSLSTDWVTEQSRAGNIRGAVQLGGAWRYRSDELAYVPLPRRRRRMRRASAASGPTGGPLSMPAF